MSDLRLRVAHLIGSDGPGGAERVIAHLAGSLQATGAFNLALLPDESERWLTNQLLKSGVTVEHFRWTKGVSPVLARSFAITMQHYGITVAHSHEFDMAVYGAWASWQAGIPHVITMHGNRYYAERLRRRLAMRAAIALSGRTVAVSNQLARQISRDLFVPRSHIEMVPNGVPWEAPAHVTLREELGLRGNDRLMVAVGNLYPVKGHRYLIEAMARVRDRHPTLHVAIAGRGDLSGALSMQARGHGLRDRVHLLGLRSDIAALLAAANVFVLPSLSEGLPLALLEAMFAGCPIVASDVGEIRTALAGGEAGVLVEAGNVAALAAAIDDVLSDPMRAQTLGARARSRAVAEYHVSQMVQRYSSIYHELLTPSIRPLALTA